jgi:hypothetical protein
MWLACCDVTQHRNRVIHERSENHYQHWLMAFQFHMQDSVFKLKAQVRELIYPVSNLLQECGVMCRLQQSRPLGCERLETSDLWAVVSG